LHLRLVASLALPTSPARDQQNPFAPRLDQPAPPPGQPICNRWDVEQALPTFGCSPQTIQKICTGQLPKSSSGPYCGDLKAHDSAMGETCHTSVCECPLLQSASLGMGCYSKGYRLPKIHV
jgi:hypothetical protein